jgi:hypothetical protein
VILDSVGVCGSVLGTSHPKDKGLDVNLGTNWGFKRLHSHACLSARELKRNGEEQTNQKLA